VIFKEISKIAAIRCQILRLKCTKFDFRWDSAPDTAGSLQRSPDPLAVFKGPDSNGREEIGKGEEGKRGREGKGREKEGKGGGDRPFRKLWLRL